MSHQPVQVIPIEQKSSQNTEKVNGPNVAKMQNSTLNLNPDIKETSADNIQSNNPEIVMQTEHANSHEKNIQKFDQGHKGIENYDINISKEISQGNMSNMDDKQISNDMKTNFVVKVKPVNNLDEASVMDTLNMQSAGLPSNILIDFPAQQIEIISTIQPPVLLMDRRDSNLPVDMHGAIANNIKLNDVDNPNFRKDLDNANRIDENNQISANLANNIIGYPAIQIESSEIKKSKGLDFKSRGSIITLDDNIMFNESSTDPLPEQNDAQNIEIESHLFTIPEMYPVEISQTVDRYLDTNELKILLSEMQTSDKLTDTDDLYWYCQNFFRPLFNKSHEKLDSHHKGGKLAGDAINSKISSKFEISAESTPSTFSDDGYVDNRRSSKKYQGSRQPLIHYLKDQKNIPKIITFVLVAVSFVAALVLIIHFSVRSITIESYYYNGSFIVTEGELFNDSLFDRESQTFQYKSNKYESELKKIFKNEYWGVEDTRIICFGKEKHQVYFEIILNKDKSLETISSDVFAKVLKKHAAIIKSGLFQDIVVDANSIQIGASKANISQCNQVDETSSQNQETTIINLEAISTPTTISITNKQELTSESKGTISNFKEPSTVIDVSSTNSSQGISDAKDTTTKANNDNSDDNTSTTSTENNTTQNITTATQLETTNTTVTISDNTESLTTLSTTNISID